VVPENRPSKASILGALSQALDLVEGQPEGHALRTAQIALRIADVLGLPDDEREDLYFAAVLKDSGCSNNAVRIHNIFGGDDHLIKRGVKLIDWTSPTESVKFAWRNTEAGRSLSAKLLRMASNARPPRQIMSEVTEARCTRGAAIAQMLSFRQAVADAIFCLDEHWNGQGAPTKRSGAAIPLLSRILSFAQTYDVFLATYGPDEANAMAHSRSAKWFDPDIVKAWAAVDAGFLDVLGDPLFVARQLPQLDNRAVESDLDAICQAFAMIIDAKSSFTSEHSTRVMQYSVQLGAAYGFTQAHLADLRRAALLHDIGKLGVPTGILEKPGRLDVEEYERVKLHPKFGHEILGRIPSFEYMAEIASCHHERLDGKGYWRGLSAEHLSLDVRIVSVCDVFDALSADRPYRDAMPLEKVWVIMDQESGPSLDPGCVAALKSVRCAPLHAAA